MLFFKKNISENALVGVWKHPILATWGEIEVVNSGSRSKQSFANHNFEIFHFMSNKTFTFGEYSKNGPLYEGRGHWNLSTDKKRIELTYDNGETISMDIRKFDGKSFITTSIQGNDFLFTKES